MAAAPTTDAAETARAYIAHQRVVDRLDSREVYDDGGLDGYVLHERGSREAITPVRCCRSCAWADADNVRHVPGEGLRYFPPS